MSPHSARSFCTHLGTASKEARSVVANMTAAAPAPAAGRSGGGAVMTCHVSWPGRESRAIACSQPAQAALAWVGRRPALPGMPRPRTPEVVAGDGVKLLLTGRVPQQEPHVIVQGGQVLHLQAQRAAGRGGLRRPHACWRCRPCLTAAGMHLLQTAPPSPKPSCTPHLLQEVNAHRPHAVLGEATPHVALEHAGLAHPSIAHDQHLHFPLRAGWARGGRAELGREGASCSCSTITCAHS